MLVAAMWCKVSSKLTCGGTDILGRLAYLQSVFQHHHLLDRVTTFVMLDFLEKVAHNPLLSMDVMAILSSRPSEIHCLGVLYGSKPIHLVPALQQGETFIRFDHNNRRKRRKEDNLVENFDVMPDQTRYYHNRWWIQFH